MFALALYGLDLDGAILGPARLSNRLIWRASRPAYSLMGRYIWYLGRYVHTMARRFELAWFTSLPSPNQLQYDYGMDSRRWYFKFGYGLGSQMNCQTDIATATRVVRPGNCLRVEIELSKDYLLMCIIYDIFVQYALRMHL